MKRRAMTTWEPFAADAEFWDDPFGLLRTFRDRLDAELKVDEYVEDGHVVIHAEMPGIDPDRDVEITVREGLVHIRAERRQEESTTERDYFHREIRYGAFHRTLALPAGADEDDVKATYENGVLEIRLPLGKPNEDVRKVPITRND